MNTTQEKRMNGVKAITIDPIWVWAIFANLKLIENRKWLTHHRGPLMIHASKNKNREAEAREWFRANTFHDPPTADTLQNQFAGRAIGVVDVLDCVLLEGVMEHEREFAEGPYCWRLANPRTFANPFEVQGKLGLWTFPDINLDKLIGDRTDG